MTVPIIRSYMDWYCPACRKTDRTVAQTFTHGERTSRFHVCPKLRFLAAPMLPTTVKAKMVLRERDDYVGRELVQLDPERGRPVAQMLTVRDDGTDARVYAPTATAR